MQYFNILEILNILKFKLLFTTKSHINCYENIKIICRLQVIRLKIVRIMCTEINVETENYKLDTCLYNNIEHLHFEL